MFCPAKIIIWADQESALTTATRRGIIPLSAVCPYLKIF
jgi:hypothetical protein